MDLGVPNNLEKAAIWDPLKILMGVVGWRPVNGGMAMS
jgi:hypothetical protein